MGSSMFKKFGKYYYYYVGSFDTLQKIKKQKAVWKKRSSKTGIDFKTRNVFSPTQYKGKMKIQNAYYKLYVLNGNMYKGKLKNK